MHFVGAESEVAEQPPRDGRSDRPSEFLRHGGRGEDQSRGPVSGFQFRIVGAVGIHRPEQREDASGADRDEHLEEEDPSQIPGCEPVEDDAQQGGDGHGGHVGALLADPVRDRGGEDHAQDVGGLPDGQIQPAQYERDAEERYGAVLLLDDVVLEVVDRGAVADRVEDQGGDSGSEQDPPGTVVQQVPDVVAQGSLLGFQGLDPFARQGEAPVEEQAAQDGDDDDGERPAVLLDLDVVAAP